MDRGEFRKYQSPTLLLCNLLERYVEEITPAKKGRDAETRRLKRLIRDEIASTPLSQLSGPILAKFRDRRIKDGKRASQYDLILIRHAIEIGRKEWGISLPVNPVNLIRIPNSIRHRKKRIGYAAWARL